MALVPLVDAQNFQEDKDGKTGLSFRLVNQCQAYLTGSVKEEWKISSWGA